MTDLACSRCGKRLSKKRARMIDGKVLCSPCMFGNRWDCGGKCIHGGLAGPGRDCDACWGGTAIAAAARQGGDANAAPGAAPQSGGEAASPTPSHPETPHDHT